MKTLLVSLSLFTLTLSCGTDDDTKTSPAYGSQDSVEATVAKVQECMESSDSNVKSREIGCTAEP